MAEIKSITIRKIDNRYLVVVDWGQTGMEYIGSGVKERIFDTYEQLDTYLQWNFGLIKVVKPGEEV